MVDTKWILAGFGITAFAFYVWGVVDSAKSLATQTCQDPNFTTQMTSFRSICPPVTANIPSQIIQYEGRVLANPLKEFAFGAAQGIVESPI